MRHSAIRKRFHEFLKSRQLKLTDQRDQIFEKVFETHEHFSAEDFFGWMRAEDSGASRATVYRTLNLLLEGGFIESLENGRGDTVYEHVLGHKHHDHLLCTECGKIEEFVDDRIEALQEEVCAERGFQLMHHSLRLLGFCKSCQRKREREDDTEEKSSPREAKASTPE